jgi:nucleotide-binding universal stress UspA family protein
MMRVLLATDGSVDAGAATDWLRGFPLPADAQFRVVSAAAVPPSPIDIPQVRDVQAAVRAQARAMAEATRTALGTRFASAEIVAPDGDPREAILRVAEEWHADLVVLGARGLGAVAGHMLGSVSIALTRHAPCPVLVVKQGARALKTALVAVDGSEPAAAAAAFLASLPLPPPASVRLLAVAEPPIGPGPDTMMQVTEKLRRVLEHTAAAFTGRASVEQRVVAGRPREHIMRAAAEPDVDLVVVGARGLGVVGRLLLGSVSEDVLRHVERPVLIVRTKH